MATKPDELDNILYKYVANRDMYLSDLEDEVITEKDWIRIRDNIQLDTKQAIQTHVDKKVNEVLDRVEQEVIYDYFGSDLVLISYNKKIQKKLKKLRSDLQ